MSGLRKILNVFLKCSVRYQRDQCVVKVFSELSKRLVSCQSVHCVVNGHVVVVLRRVIPS